MLQLLKAELFKIKKNKSLYLMLFGQFIVFLLATYILVKEIRPITGKNPDMSFLLKTFTTFSFFALTYFSYFQVILFSTSICETERRNNGYKQLFILPVSKSKIYFSKQILYILVLLTSWVIYILAYLASAYLVSRIYNVTVSSLIYNGAAHYFFNVFMGILSLYSLQYLLSLFFNKFLIPIGIGIIGFAAAIISIGLIFNNGFSYNPYTYPLVHFFHYVKSDIFSFSTASSGYIIASFIAFLLFSSLSYFYFVKRIDASKR